MKKHVLIAFDGLSLAGKSTVVQMLYERSADAVIIRENAFDPIRPFTSKANKLLKERKPSEVIDCLKAESPQFEKVFTDALSFSGKYDDKEDRRQALLAYLFTAGRKFVDKKARSEIRKKDVILDRWQVTGWAYQVAPALSWQDIKKLNADFGIIMPDIQFLLTCPIKQIPVRRAYRDKTGLGTAGQMSRGREDVILKAFQEIHSYLEGRKGITVLMFENAGQPVKGLWPQIKQAIPTFKKVEKIVSQSSFSLSSKPDDPESYWSYPDRLTRIYEQQKGVVKK